MKTADALVESLLNESQGINHGDIVSLSGYLRRPGYWKVDTENAVGASHDRPWVEDVDTNTGFYVDPSDIGCLSVVLQADEFDTDNINSSAQVEAIMNEDDDFEHDDEDDGSLRYAAKVNGMR